MKSYISKLGLSLAVCALGLALFSGQAMAKRYQHVRVYHGVGTVTAIDQANDVFTVDFDSANRALRNALGGDLSNVSVAVDGNTDFALNGDDWADVGDLCESDQVDVVIKTRDRLSGHDLTDHPAYSVQATADDGQCLNNDDLAA